MTGNSFVDITALILSVAMISAFFGMHRKLTIIAEKMENVEQCMAFLAVKAGAEFTKWECVNCENLNPKEVLICECGHVRGTPKKEKEVTQES